jgi:uncharacterized damage-inducible protein DinB
MTDLTCTQALLTDSFQRIRDLVAEVTTGLSPAAAGYRPDAAANSIGWLVWHLSRVQDDHLAELAGVDQVWPRWRDRFALPLEPDATGYAQSSADVAAVQVEAGLLADYHTEVHELTQRYLDGLTEAELGRVVDERWDPPVTVSVRLVSVIGDCLQHLGQASYVRGLTDRQAS